MATALGGGYLASGAATGRAYPCPICRRVCVWTAGGRGGGPDAAARHRRRPARLGDRVYMRHAKAGELCERFASLHLLEGERIVEEVPTYRGEGQCFL